MFTFVDSLTSPLQSGMVRLRACCLVSRPHGGVAISRERCIIRSISFGVYVLAGLQTRQEGVQGRVVLVGYVDSAPRRMRRMCV